MMALLSLLLPLLLRAGQAAAADELTAIVELTPPPPPPGSPPQVGELAVAQLFVSNGTVAKHYPPFGKSGGGMTGACNAGFDPVLEVWHKTTSDGKILTVDARLGEVVLSVDMQGGPQRSTGAETFLAGPDAAGLFYSAEPLTRTSYTILSYNVTSGAVEAVATLPKGDMAGIGVCVGFVVDSGLLYIYDNGLVRFDLVNHTVSPAIKDFVAPIRADPAHPGTFLGVSTREGSGPDDVGGPQVTALSRYELSGLSSSADPPAPKEIFVFNETYYHKLCHCTLPIRPQDQADMDISTDGSTVYIGESAI
jgi:hypothetical protein